MQKWQTLLVAAASLAGVTSVALAREAATPELPQLHSKDGILQVDMVAAEGKIQIGDLEVPGITFNGQYAGPVLRLRPGELLSLKLTNNLDEPTNLHFHGIRCTPLGNSDNVHVLVQPHSTFTYAIRIPLTQPTGLYFYHVHPHGLSKRQVEGGLSGAMIVENPDQPSINEHLFVLKDMMFDDDTGNDIIDDDLHGHIQSINGNLLTNITMRSNETQLWRLTDESADRPFHLAIPGHRFHIIEEDAENVLDDRWVDEIDMVPGKRFEVLIEGGQPGNYEIISKGMLTGTGASRKNYRVLGHLDVMDNSRPATSVVMPTLPTPPDLRDLPIGGRQEVSFTQTKTLKLKEQQFFINGKIFTPDRMDVRVPLGTVQEWTIRNDSDDMHVFHIHQIGYQIVEINGKPQPFQGYVDTVKIPEHGEVKLLLPFTDPMIVGRFLFHCHVLRHEDSGMMANVEVYDPKATGVTGRLNRFYIHVWYWLHGVPWALCGLPEV